MIHLKVVSIIIITLCLSGGTLTAEELVSHNPSADIQSGWADGSIEASASGYNDGSIMNPGRHWVSADNFVITDPANLPWQIDKITFICGTALNASVDTYRVSVYLDDNGSPADYFWQYEENADSPDNISANQTSVGGTWDRWVHEIDVDTSGLGLILESNLNYYLSIEGDCSNPDDIYNGYDTYYQRFYMLSSVDSATSTQMDDVHWYTQADWNSWQKTTGDFVWTVEGHQVPEPCSLSILLLGTLVITRCRRY